MKTISSLFKLLFFAGSVVFFSCGSAKKSNYETMVVNSKTTTTEVKPETAADKDSKIRSKYAAYLSTMPDSITNMRLYNFIDTWLNTPYLWGGTTRSGIDCSAFMQRLLADVYGIQIPRTSIQQFFTNNVEPFGSRHYLKEGDLVFFHTIDNNQLITHVGLYLGNRMFVNASSSYGVSIANMDNAYWKTRYVAAGRVRTKKGKK